MPIYIVSEGILFFEKKNETECQPSSYFDCKLYRELFSGNVAHVLGTFIHEI